MAIAPMGRDGLLRVEEGVDKPRPKVLFEAGQVVRVTHGPFNDFNGVVENVNYEKNRVRPIPEPDDFFETTLHEYRARQGIQADDS